MSTWPAEIEGAVGARGLVVRWEHTDFTITSTTTPEELAAIADRYNSPRWALPRTQALPHSGETGYNSRAGMDAGARGGDTAMSEHFTLDTAALDRHITGNWGEDSVAQPVPTAAAARDERLVVSGDDDRHGHLSE